MKKKKNNVVFRYLCSTWKLWATDIDSLICSRYERAKTDYQFKYDDLLTDTDFLCVWINLWWLMIISTELLEGSVKIQESNCYHPRHFTASSVILKNIDNMPATYKNSSLRKLLLNVEF